MVGLNPALRLSLKGYFKPFNFAIIWEVMGIGIPASIESVLFNGGKLLTQMFVAGMGTNVIAGNFIAFSVASLINLPGNALGSASTIITGKRLGKGQIGQAEFRAWHVFWLSTIILTLIAGGSAFAGFIASFYTHEEDVKKWLNSCCGSTPCLCRSGRCRGLYPALLKAPVTYATPCGCRCSACGAAGWWRAIPGHRAGDGVIGVWLGMVLDWAVRGVLFYFRMVSGRWLWKYPRVKASSEES